VLSGEIKKVLTEEGDFEKYLTAVMRIALLERKNKPPERTAQQLTISLAPIVFALLAAFSGGLLWNMLNHIFGWRFYMGGSDNEPAGISAFVWGLTVGVPIITFALLSLRTVKPPPAIFAKSGWWLVILIYPLVTGITGLFFYTSGFRGFVEGYAYPYGFQELIIVIVYALLLSVVPLMVVLALLRFPKMSRVMLAVILAAPVLVSALSVAWTMLVDRPDPEVAQLRGFLVGLTLKLAMFIAVRTVMAGSYKVN